jgi:long-chain fatty acid transport protein
MNKNMKIVAALMAVGLVSPMAYATNGDEMMAVGSQSSALGGTGVANYMGAESAWANPAMLGKSTGSEVVGGITLFKPKVTNTGMPGGVATDSKANTFYIPDVSYSSRSSDSLSWGIAMAGIAGMGVDYSDGAASHIKAKSALSIARVIPTIAYNTKEYGVGFSPVLQYGSLALSYDATALFGAGASSNLSEKADTNTGFGYSIGGYFNVMPALVLAASYQSEIAMKYGTQISDAGKGFGLYNGGAGAPFGDDLNQPAEMKLGVAYTMSNVTMTADYKSIAWGSAAGYKDFNWKDQTVVALGVKYAANGYWLGAGYNDANDPIAEATPGSSYRNDAINFFNNMFFPAVVKTSYTFGGGYDFSKALAIEAAVVISPEVKKTVGVPSFGGPGATNTTTHSQSSYLVSLRYKF